MARVKITSGTIDKAVCEVGKSAQFIWDSEAPGLGLRVTPAGTKRYIFQAKVKKQREVVRVKIGDVRSWSIDEARTEARRLKQLMDGGHDPRQVEADDLAAKEAARDAAQTAKDEADALEKRNTITFAQVWGIYLEDRKPDWGDRHYQDHVKKFAAGGVKASRGTRGLGVTIAGPLRHFADMPLIAVDASVVEKWAKAEGKTRPTSARLAWRMLKAFFQWCQESKEYGGFLPSDNPGKTKKSRTSLGKASTKKDVLLTAQLPGWFEVVKKIGNPTISAYLQVLLLTGARPGEILAMKWDDINWRWASIVIRDKVEGTRTITLTPYVAHLIAALPRRNEYVFSSAVKGVDIIGKPHAIHKEACQAIDLEGLTFHGLRRSFASLSAQMEIVGGAAMQIQGHKPTSVREKAYIIWPQDVLNKAHFKIEAEILAKAKIDFVPAAPGLRVITAA